MLYYPPKHDNDKNLKACIVGLTGTDKYFDKPKWLIKIDKKVSALYIKYSNKTIEKVLSNEKLLIRTFGVSNARKIILRLNQIKAASSLGAMLTQRVGRCHPLSGDRMGQFAFDVEQPYRLIVMRSMITRQPSRPKIYLR